MKISDQVQEMMLLIPHAFYLGVQSLRRAQLSATPWTAAHQASLSFTISQSSLKLMAIESLVSSNHLILCHPLLLQKCIVINSEHSFASYQVPKLLLSVGTSSTGRDFPLLTCISKGSCPVLSALYHGPSPSKNIKACSEVASSS